MRRKKKVWDEGVIWDEESGMFTEVPSYPWREEEREIDGIPIQDWMDYFEFVINHLDDLKNDE